MSAIQNSSDGVSAEAVLARISKSVNSAVSVTDVKTRWGEVVKRARRNPMTITCKGKPEAVLLSHADYRHIVSVLIEQAEHAEDLAAGAAYKPEDCIPYKEIRADLKRNGRL